MDEGMSWSQTPPGNDEGEMEDPNCSDDADRPCVYFDEDMGHTAGEMADEGSYAMTQSGHESNKCRGIDFADEVEGSSNEKAEEEKGAELYASGEDEQ